MKIWFLLFSFIRACVCAPTVLDGTWSDDIKVVAEDPYGTDVEAWYLHADQLASGDYLRYTGSQAKTSGYSLSADYSGPYYIYGLYGTTYKNIVLERAFECTGALSISFQYCHCGMGPSNTFTVKYVNSNGYTHVASSTPADQDGTTLATDYIVSGPAAGPSGSYTASYGYDYNALSSKDKCGTAYYDMGYSWICTSTQTLADFEFGWGVELLLQFDVSVNGERDAFAFKNFEATCDTSVEREIYTEATGCIDYDPFALIASDPSQSLVFGFKTYKPSDITMNAEDATAHGTVVVDLYDSAGGLYRCHHLGIGFHVLYQCLVDINENVVQLSSDSNPEGYTNKMIIRGFEFIRAYVQAAIITTIDPSSTDNFISDGSIDASAIMFARLWDTEPSLLNASSSVMSFSLDITDTETCITMDTRLDDDPFTLNGVDTQFGITIDDATIEIESVEVTRAELAESISLFVQSAQTAKVNPIEYEENECIWNAGLDEAIAGITTGEEEEEEQDVMGGTMDLLNTMGAVTAIIPGGGALGGAMMAASSVYGLITGCGVFKECGPSKEEEMVNALAESTTYAMEAMKTSMDSMMVCSTAYTDHKITELRAEMDAKTTNLENSISDLDSKVAQQMTLIEGEFGTLRAAINDVNERMDLQKQELKEEFDAKLAAQAYKQALELDIRMIDMEYKVHIENVEQDIANLLDTMYKLNRQWDHINTLTDTSEIIAELSSMLQFTMPRFAGVVKRKPNSAEFDFFWRLYAQELTVFLMQIMTMRMDIWTLWIHFNMVADSMTDITEITADWMATITPDYHRGFRDLNGELISEYIDLLPYAMYAIIDSERDSTQMIQRTKLLDGYKEIEYRFQPKTACAWIEYTLYMTATDDPFFLGVSEIEALYDADINVCADNVRKYVIDSILSIDEAHATLYTSTRDSYAVPGFMVQSTDYNAEAGWNSITGSNYCSRNNFQSTGTCYDCCSAGYDFGDTSFATPGWEKTFNHGSYSSPGIDYYDEALYISGFTWSIAPTWYYTHYAYESGVGYVLFTKPFNYHLLDFTTWNVNEEIASDEQTFSDSLIDEGDVTYDAEMGELLSATAKCSAGFAVSAIRFGYHYSTVNDYEGWNQHTFGSILELNGFKLLCRPLSQVSYDLYRSFTLYEIVSASWFDEAEVDVYSEWYGCPIGTVIKSISYNYDYQSDPSNAANSAFNSGMQLECGNIDALNLLELKASEYSGYLPSSVVKYVTDNPIFALVIAVALVSQILVCVVCLRKKSSHKYAKVEHFDYDSTTDVTDVDAI